MDQLTLYAAKTEDGGVTIYRDADRSKIACHYSASREDKPNKRKRWFWFNCYRWRLEWL